VKTADALDAAEPVASLATKQPAKVIKIKPRAKQGMQSIFDLMDVKPFDLEQYATQEIDPNSIKVERRIRSDMGDIDDLAESIRTEGQINPIEVVQMPDGPLVLEDGERRLRACQKLNVFVRAEVMRIRKPSDVLQWQHHKLVREIHATTKRKSFDVLEEAEALLRSKELYERAYPQTKHGRATKKSDVPSVPRFTTVASKALDVSERHVYDLIAVAALPVEKKREIAEASAGEKNRLIQKVMRDARQERKIQNLEASAKEKQQMPIPDKGASNDRVPAVLHQGNCLDFMTGSNLYELILTDPPYEKGRTEINHTARASMNAEDHEWDVLDVEWVAKAAPLLKPGGSLLAFSPLEAVGDYQRVAIACGLEYRQSLIWVKTNPAPSHRPIYPFACEAIVWLVKPGAKAFFNREVANVGADHKNVFSGPSMPGSATDRVHPTQKPTWLIEALLKIHAEAPFHVFDPFSGAGTTGVCARKLGMPSTMVELDPKFVKASQARLDAV